MRMARRAPLKSAFASGLVWLVAGCGPQFVDDDRFVEEQCAASCDRLDECGQYFDDCE